MTESGSNGQTAVELLDRWLRRILAEGPGEPVVAKDLVFRDLYSLLAQHPQTGAALASLHRQIGEAKTSSIETRRELQWAIDTAVDSDSGFAEALTELLHVLRPFLSLREPLSAPEPLAGALDVDSYAARLFSEPTAAWYEGEPTGPIIRPYTHTGGRQGTESIEPALLSNPGFMDRILNSLRKLDSDTVTPTSTDPKSIPVSIYLSDAQGSEQVQAAVEAMLASAGAEIIERDDPVLGSWFRRLRARHKESSRELATTAMHAVEAHLVHSQDAVITANMMQHLGPTIASIQDYEEAVIRAGALLIVKLGPQLIVQQLTPAQQFQLDHQPELAYSPRLVLKALKLQSAAPVNYSDGSPPTENWLA